MAYASTRRSRQPEHRATTGPRVSRASQKLNARLRAARQWLADVWSEHPDETYNLNPAVTHARNRRQQLDAVLLESLRPFMLGGGLMMAGAGFYLAYVMDSILRLVALVLGSVIGIAFLKVYMLVRAGRIPIALAHPLAATISIVGFTQIIFSLLADRDAPGDLRFMGLALTVVMASALYLELRWLIGMMIFMITSWTLINVALGYDFIWDRHGGGFFFIVLTTLIAFAVRKRAIVRMIEAQEDNERQNAQLVEALERAHRSEAELHVERYLANQIVESMGQGLVLLDDDGRIDYANPAAGSIFGAPLEALTGRRAIELFRESGANPPELFGGSASLSAETEQTFEVLIDRQDGTSSNVLISVASRETGGTILTFTDLTPRREFEKKLERLAHYDALTGLANRAHFVERLTELAGDRRRQAAQLGLLFIDLDRFKQVNDTRGHTIGDEVLIEMAHRIERCIRAQDIAARFGGDEFVVLLVDIESAAAAGEIAERIVSSIEEPFVLSDSIETLSASVGVSMRHALDTAPEELIRRADVAMYEAKRNRTMSTVVYSPDAQPLAFASV